MASQGGSDPPYPILVKNILLFPFPINWNRAYNLYIRYLTCQRKTHNINTTQIFKMQAALSISPTTLVPLTTSKNFSQVAISTPKLVGSSLASRRSAIKVAATTSNDPSTFDYNSAFS